MMTRWLATTLVCCLLAGCPDSKQGPAESTSRCRKLGEQCRLDDGLLGVCSARENGELFCMSQH